MVIPSTGADTASGATGDAEEIEASGTNETKNKDKIKKIIIFLILTPSHNIYHCQGCNRCNSDPHQDCPDRVIKVLFRMFNN